jgi:hypothetical protein
MKIIVLAGALSATDWFRKPTAGSTFIVEVFERMFCKTSGVTRSYGKNVTVNSSSPLQKKNTKIIHCWDMYGIHGEGQF